MLLRSKDSFTGSPSLIHDYTSSVLFYIRGWSAPTYLVRHIFKELPRSLHSLQYFCLTVTFILFYSILFIFLTGKDNRQKIFGSKVFQLSNSALVSKRERPQASFNAMQVMVFCTSYDIAEVSF